MYYKPAMLAHYGSWLIYQSQYFISITEIKRGRAYWRPSSSPQSGPAVLAVREPAKTYAMSLNESGYTIIAVR